MMNTPTEVDTAITNIDNNVIVNVAVTPFNLVDHPERSDCVVKLGARSQGVNE